MDIETPVGSVNALLERPDTTIHSSQFSYCNDTYTGPSDVDPYINSNSQNSTKSLICDVWPPEMVLFPTNTNQHMVISTRVSEKMVKLESNCSYQYFSNADPNIRTGCGPTTQTVVSRSPNRYLAGSMCI